MGSCDFTKTASQVQKEVLGMIDSIDRSLDSSNGDIDRKGQLALNALISLLVVFGSILGIEHFVGRTSAEPNHALVQAALPPAISSRELRLLDGYLTRINSNAESIEKVKSNVAPSMPIDAQVVSIKDAVVDSRRLMGLDGSP